MPAAAGVGDDEDRFVAVGGEALGAALTLHPLRTLHIKN